MEKWKYGLIGLAGLASLTSCAEKKPTIPPTPTTQTAKGYSEIGLYYPALANFPIRETGQINTERSSTKWLNLGSVNFDSNLANQAFDYFENLARSKKMLSYEFSGYSIPLLPESKPVTNRVIFLVPPQAPNPDWPGTSSTASTTRLFIDPYVSFVRTYNAQQDIPQSKVFTTPDKAANKSLAVEICQSTIQMRSSTVEMANLGQEIFCNSWGSAFALKQYDFTYDQYLQWANDTLIRANPQSPAFPILVLTEADYQDIPKIGPVIKS